MGRVARATPATGKLVRGVFSRPGVLDGALFVAAGSQLYQVSSAWAATALGPIQGATGTVLFDNSGANLVLLAGGSLYKYDGTSLTTNTDSNFPLNAATLASLADRILSSQEGSDTFDWSAVGDPLTWPATGFAASARLPDPIINQIVVGGDKFDFGANSIQPWRAMGGDDSEAFDVSGSVVIDKGLIGRDAFFKLDSSIMWIGDDRVVYQLNGYAPQRISNRDVEIALASLTDDQAASVQGFSYLQGSHLIGVFRLPTGRSFALDTMNGLWSERTTWGQDLYQTNYYANCQGKHVVASDQSDVIYTWETDTYDDGGLIHERVMMLHVPVSARTIISSICLDMKVIGQPLSGQGSSPQAMVTFYTDGGSRDSIESRGVERMVELGSRGSFARRPMIHRLGMVNAADGFLMKIRITDPINFALSGVWINENPT